MYWLLTLNTTLDSDTWSYILALAGIRRVDEVFELIFFII